MKDKTYIESGILELYIAGKLSKSKNKEVYEMMKKYPEVTKEVLDIEHAVVSLTKGLNNKPVSAFSKLMQKIRLNNDDSITLNSSNNWATYSGWAAAIILAGGFIWSLNTASNFEKELTNVKENSKNLEIELNTNRIKLQETQQTLAEKVAFIETTQNSDVINVSLEGQAIAPEAYAKVYWDKTNKEVYLDLSGLPEPPKGKVYQVWSLTLEPLTPTNLGLASDFNTTTNKVFKFSNANASEAFGITLEPEGGSSSPTLEQLYTLGTIPNA